MTDLLKLLLIFALGLTSSLVFGSDNHIPGIGCQVIMTATQSPKFFPRPTKKISIFDLAGRYHGANEDRFLHFPDVPVFSNPVAIWDKIEKEGSILESQLYVVEGKPGESDSLYSELVPHLTRQEALELGHYLYELKQYIDSAFLEKPDVWGLEFRTRCVSYLQCLSADDVLWGAGHSHSVEPGHPVELTFSKTELGKGTLIVKDGEMSEVRSSGFADAKHGSPGPHTPRLILLPAVSFRVHQVKFP